MVDSDLVNSVRVRIRDSESTEQGMSWNDTYSIYASDDRVGALKSYQKRESATEIFFTNDHIDLGEIPERVAAAMQKYIDDSTVNWPSSFPPQAVDVDREEAEIQLELDDIEYTIWVYSGEQIRIEMDGERARVDDIPAEIRSEADQYIPEDAEYL